MDGDKETLVYHYPMFFLTGQHIFSARSMNPRKPVPAYMMNYIDKILYSGRFKAAHETYNLYKTEGIEYSKEELQNCRMLTKALNGLVFTTDIFKEMYPEATFFAWLETG